MRWTLFPRWQGGDLSATAENNEQAAYHLQQLIERSDCLFLFAANALENCLSYDEWFKTLNTVAMDRYWNRSPVNSRCTHILRSETGDTVAGSVKSHSSAGTSKTRLTKKLSLKSVRSEFVGNSASGRAIRPSEPRSTKDLKNKKVEEIIISDSDASEEDKSEVGTIYLTEAGDSDDDYPMPTPGYYREHRKSSYDQRSVVTPPIFEMDGKTSLKDFLVIYEQYFMRKYNGSEHDQTQQLSQFLQGELLEVFNVRGGRKMKYKDMKDYLLGYYKKLKIGGKTFWRKELGTAMPGYEEGLDIYGMRLIEIAGNAYPNDKKESARRLRSHYLSSIPSSVASKILDTERALKAANNKTKYMTFDRIIEMAKEIQKSTKKTKTVMFSNKNSASPLLYHDSRDDHSVPPASSREQQEWGQNFRHQGRRELDSDYPPRQQRQHWLHPDKGRDEQLYDHQQQQHHRPRQLSDGGRQFRSRSLSRSRPEGNSQRGVACNYCKKTGHIAKNCWRASKSCLICGKDHYLERCPRFDPNYNSKTQDKRQFLLN